MLREILWGQAWNNFSGDFASTMLDYDTLAHSALTRCFRAVPSTTGRRRSPLARPVYQKWPHSLILAAVTFRPSPLRLRLQRFDDGFGILGSDPQQGTAPDPPGPCAPAPSSDGGNAHTDQEGEFRLRLAEGAADRLDIVGANSVTRLGFISPRRMAPACRMLATN